MKRVIDLKGTSKRYVTQGPHLWVSKLLQIRGPISSSKIWEEYGKDKEAQELELFRSKAFLK